MIRLRKTASSYFSGVALNPGAMTEIMNGEKSMPQTVTIVKQIAVKVIAVWAISRASVRLPAAR